MFGLNQQIAKRSLLSAAVLVMAAAAVLVLPWAGRWPTVRLVLGWLHDGLWLPVLGYGFYWAAPWSQVAAVTCGVAMAAWWVAWLLDVPILSLPALVLSWLYLGWLQPSGGFLILVRRWEFRLFRQSRPLQDRTARTTRDRREQKPSSSVLLLVGHALARRDEERVRAAELRCLAQEAEQMPEPVREAARQRLLFLANYHCPAPGMAGLCYGWELERSAVYFTRALAVAKGADTETRERLHRVFQTYYRAQFPAIAASVDVATLVLRSPPDAVRPVPRALAILDLLLGYGETCDPGRLETAEIPIRRGLTRVWQICQTLDGFRLRTVPPFQLEELRRSGGNAARSDLSLLGLGDVLEPWMAVLLRRGEFETVANAARIALELASPNIETRLSTVRQLPWDDSDKEALSALLQENRVERPEAIRYLSARAWLGLRQALPAGASADLALEWAIADCFERGDLEWIAGAENSVGERSSN
jgi:hypothetical protein